MAKRSASSVHGERVGRKERRTIRKRSDPMIGKSKWTTTDFETLSWHDCHFYGLRLDPRKQGTAELEFDIDFIVEWICQTDRSIEFRVAPATLIFHNVFGLRVELDYASPVLAGMLPFAIDGIEREVLSRRSVHSSFRWRLPVNWPSGVITFESPGFSQVLRRPPILVDRQWLLSRERG
jgi:hypothetical protein